MKNFNYLFLFLTLSLLSFQMSCDSTSASINTGGVTIKGELANASNLSFYFDKINFDNSNHMYPKAEIDANGKFVLNIEDPLEAGIYRMRIGAKRAFMILNGKESLINIKGDLATFDKYEFTIEGADASTGFLKQMKGIQNRSIDDAAAEAYINSESNSIAAAFIAMNRFANKPDKFNVIQSTSAKLAKQHPDSKYNADFKNLATQIQGRIAQMKATEKIQVGKPAPEIKLEDPNGKEIALSDLKGKIVLLDFWASWCGPCRKANPHVVETYKKYKNKGFTVYSVSLDGINPRLLNRYKTQEEIDNQLNAAKKRWEAAIEKDQLEWDNHVSDLQYWNSIAAKTYGVRSIPQTFLIDRDGKIAALNPRFNLEQELLKLL